MKKILCKKLCPEALLALFILAKVPLPTEFYFARPMPQKPRHIERYIKKPGCPGSKNYTAEPAAGKPIGLFGRNKPAFIITLYSIPAVKNLSPLKPKKSHINCVL
jgi:hypothetical protein